MLLMMMHVFRMKHFPCYSEEGTLAKHKVRFYLSQWNYHRNRDSHIHEGFSSWVISKVKHSFIITIIIISRDTDMECPPRRRLYITNITASATLDEKLELRNLALKMIDVEYDKNKFSSLVHRLRTPRATCMISANGHIICVGTNSIRDAVSGLRKTKHHIANALNRGCATFKLQKFKIHNIAAAYTYGTRLNVHALHQFNTTSCRYDPTIFSGLRFQGLGPGGKIKAIIFPSGNIILTGASNIKSLRIALRELNLKIRESLAIVRKRCAPTHSILTKP